MKRKLLLVILGLALLVGAGAASFLFRTLGRISHTEGPETLIAAEEEYFEADEDAGEDTLVPQELVWATPEPAEEKKHITNILLIGQDRRGRTGRGNSDSMVLCSINEHTDVITLTSLMRDMYVPFPGDYSDNRINAAYPFGGMPLLDQLIEEDFGVVIDGNIEVDFRGFIAAMDMIAPLDIELKRYEVGYMNSGTDWHLREGVNAMNGEQLLRYARMRHVGHADWERTERQRTVLRAAFEKIRGWKLSEILDLLDAVLPYLTTDLSNKELLELIHTVAVHHMTIGETFRLPVEGSYSSEVIRGMMVLVPDLQENSRVLREMLYG